MTSGVRGPRKWRTGGSGAMRRYHIGGMTPWGQVNLDLPRSDISEMKRVLRTYGHPGYDRMLNLIALPGAMIVLMVPGTRRLMYMVNACIILVRVGIAGVVILLVLKQWWWALGCAGGAYMVSAYIQTWLNYEIGARLFALLRALPEHDGSGRQFDAQGLRLEDLEARLR